MNKIWTYLVVIAIMASALSCEKIEPVPNFDKSGSQISVTSSVDAVAASATDSLETVVSFTWSDPEYSVGLEKSKFTLKVAGKGTDFVDFLSKEYTGVLEGSLIGKELNGMALRLGGAIGQPVDLDVMIVATHLNNNEPIESNVITITVTPYEDLALVPSSTSVVCSASTALEEGVSFTWNAAFNGFDGVKTYEFQYAKSGTDFASPTVIEVSSFSYSFTQFELNKLALDNGVALEAEGSVEFRIKATNELGEVIYSNVVSVSITTYSLDPVPLYLVGNATAADWDNNSTYAIFVDKDDISTYHYTGFFKAGSFKLLETPGQWQPQWGKGAADGLADVNDGSGSDPNTWDIPSDGYYSFTLNVASKTYTLESYDASSNATYTSIGLVGPMANGWPDGSGEPADRNMTQSTFDTHIWYITNTALNADIGKFRADDGWAVNWGDSGFPVGLGVQDGSNIAIDEAANYNVWFNDITGRYYFIKQ